MKRFIIISLLAIGCWQHVSACIWFDNHNSYLFRVCNEESFSSRVDKITLENWKAYLGTSQDYYWFDADEVIKVAQNKGDALMVSYVQQLSKYLECVEEVRAEQWDYPSKEDINKRKQKLTAIRTYAQGKLKTRLRSQHALLFMRCNMMLGRHAENVTFWEQTASQYIETVYKDMMKNIYAGALYKTGKGDVAGQLFAEMEDWSSLMTQYYKKRSFAAIRQEYLRDANSAVLPFLLQDFVNNAQEAIDAQNEGGFAGKLFVRDITRSEAQQMWQFAGQVVREGKTQTPALWKSAQAWLEYLFGQKQQALIDANEAVTLEGTELMRDVARIVQFYIKSAQSPLSPEFDDYVAGELEWFKAKNSYAGALDRTVVQILIDKYQNAGRKEIAYGLMRTIGSYQYPVELEKMSASELLVHLNNMKQAPKTRLERALNHDTGLTETELPDLIGTKYLRECQWEQAQEWLAQVPLSYYNERGYAIYAAKRSYTVEPWITRQWLPFGMEWDHEPVNLRSNPKLNFAREMQKMEGELSVLTGKAREQRCYELAVRYAQACLTGDCWWILTNSKSSADTAEDDKTDYTTRAVNYLQQASRTSDTQLKERALFALSYVYLHPDRWCEFEWDGNLGDLVRKPSPQASQYKAFATLLKFEQSKGSRTSDYVSRCDEYVQFKHLYR